MQTNDQVPSIVIANTLSGVDWQNPDNILFSDGNFAVASDSTQILIVGYVGKINLPVGATTNNIVVSVKGYRGAFNTTLQIYAIDNTSGTPVYYPMSPSFQGFDGTNTLWVLPATLFGNTWSVNAINNLALKLVANGELYLDTVEVNVIYTPAVIPPTTTVLDYNTLAGGTFTPGDTITGLTSGATGIVATDNGVNEMTLSSVAGVYQVGETISNGSGVTAVVANPVGLTVCDEFVEALPFQLAQSMTSTSLFMYLSSFNYPDGSPINITDFHGDAIGVIDQGVPGKEEPVRIVGVQQNWNATGMVQIAFGTLGNRGLGYQWPYTSVPALRQDHGGTAEFVLSNPAVFYDRFIKKCQADALFSVPIEVKDEGTSLTTSLHLLNFLGDGVTAVLNALHNVFVTITDHFVKISSSDTTQGYLMSKLVAGSGISFTKINPGGNEMLLITNTGGGGGGGVLIAHNGTLLPSEPILNFKNYFTIADNPGTTSTDVSIDVTALANDTTFINALTSNTTFISLIVALGGGALQVDQTPDNGTYGTLAGAVNGSNTDFTVSQALYTTGKLQVFLNGLIQLQGASDDWHELVPGSGTFRFSIAPLTGDIITVVYTIPGSGGTGTAIVQAVHQVAHGFADGNIITSSGTAGAYKKSKADAPANAEVVGIVTKIVDADNFQVTTEGFFTLGVPAQAAGTIMFLSDVTAGGLIATAPTGGTTVSKPLVQIITNGAIGYFHNYRGQNNQTIPAGTLSYSNGVFTKDATDASTTLSVPHGLAATPTRIFVEWSRPLSNGTGAQTISGSGAFDASGQTCVWSGLDTNGAVELGGTDTKALHYDYGSGAGSGGNTQNAVLSADATNIIFTWTKTSSPTGVFNISWRAETQ